METTNERFSNMAKFEQRFLKQVYYIPADTSNVFTDVNGLPYQQTKNGRIYINQRPKTKLQLMEFYNNTIKNLGCTYNIATNEMIQNKGYFVSIASEGLKMDLDSFTPEILRKYVISKMAFFRYDFFYLGSYIKDNVLYLDVSVKFEREKDAKIYAKHNHQICIYDAERAQIINVN